MGSQAEAGAYSPLLENMALMSCSLGHGFHTEYELKALHECPPRVISIALGQDHTLALTAEGEVYSWGLNRYSQLGYVVEPTGAKVEEPIQLVPKRVYGPLKKEFVRGLATCKSASVCWTSSETYSWGTNNGQLGMLTCACWSRALNVA